MTARGWALVSCLVLAGCAVTPINIPNSDSGALEAHDRGRATVVEVGAPGTDASRVDAGMAPKADAAARDGSITGGDGLKLDRAGEGPRPDISGGDATGGKDAKPKVDKGKTD